MSGYDPDRMVPLLQSVAIELTNFCNLSCDMCWSQNPIIHPPRAKGFMSLYLYKKVIDDLETYYKMSKKRILLCLSFGGESLLHPSFDEMLTYAKDKKCFKLQLITNGLLLREHIPILARIGVMVTISYHKLRPDLKEILQRNITSMIARRGSNRLNVAVVDEEEPGLFNEAKALFPHITYNYPMITEDLKYTDGLRKGDPYCKSPFHYMAILWNGDVWPCCHLLSSDFPSMGNLNNGTIMEIWEGEAYNHLRKNPENFPCSECELW